MFFLVLTYIENVDVDNLKVQKGVEKFDIALQKLDEDDSAREFVVNMELKNQEQFNYDEVTDKTRLSNCCEIVQMTFYLLNWPTGDLPSELICRRGSLITTVNDDDVSDNLFLKTSQDQTEDFDHQV